MKTGIFSALVRVFLTPFLYIWLRLKMCYYGVFFDEISCATKSKKSNRITIINLLRFRRCDKEITYERVWKIVSILGRFASWDEVEILEKSGRLPKDTYSGVETIRFPVVTHYDVETWGKIGPISPLWYGIAWPCETRFAVVVR